MQLFFEKKKFFARKSKGNSWKIFKNFCQRDRETGFGFKLSSEFLLNKKTRFQNLYAKIDKGKN